MNVRVFLLSLFIVIIAACQPKDPTTEASTGPRGLISDPLVQDSLFKTIRQITAGRVDEAGIGDTLAFLFLPVQASCPACRKKTIDSIVKYQNRLGSQHFVVITGSGGRTIGGYFKEQDTQMPIKDQIYYDTTGQSKLLSSNTPNLYFAVGGRVYRKVSCTPSSIKRDLAEFFGGL